jgi:hypothetical protein
MNMNLRRCVISCLPPAGIHLERETTNHTEPEFEKMCVPPADIPLEKETTNHIEPEFEKMCG